MKPKRIQLRRTKGWRMPAGAVVVARPSKWGNPFRVGSTRSAAPIASSRFAPVHYFKHKHPLKAGEAVEHFKDWLRMPAGQDMAAAARAELRGKDQACWCKLCHRHRDGLPLGETCDQCAPCHADVLLEVANA